MKKASIGIAIEGLPFICMCSFSALIFSLIGWRMMGLIMLAITWVSSKYLPAKPGALLWLPLKAV